MFMIFVMASVAGYADPEIDAEQFLRLIGQLHADVRDVELVCEGRILALVDRDGRALPEDNPRDIDHFQSKYTYRSDGAVLWEMYRKGENDGTFTKKTSAAIGGDQFSLFAAPDRDGPRAPLTHRKGGASSLNFDGSPGRFYHKYRWDDLIAHRDRSTYQFEGWEIVDGHTCLRIALKSGSLVKKFWIDLERGGHSLKYEQHHSEGTMKGLWVRLDDVQLAEFTLPDGKRTWFPVSAVVETFIHDLNGPKPYPVFRESYQVVRGSVVFNQNLPDERFSVTREGPGSSAPGSLALGREFDAIEPRSGPETFRTDAAGIQEELERRLAAADRQARALDASPPSTRTFNSTTITQLAFGTFGVAAVAVAILLRRRA